MIMLVKNRYQLWRGCFRTRGSYDHKVGIPHNFCFMTKVNALKIIWLNYGDQWGRRHVILSGRYEKKGEYLEFWGRIETNEDVIVSSQGEATDPKGESLVVFSWIWFMNWRPFGWRKDSNKDAHWWWLEWKIKNDNNVVVPV